MLTQYFLLDSKNFFFTQNCSLITKIGFDPKIFFSPKFCFEKKKFWDAYAKISNLGQNSLKLSQKNHFWGEMQLFFGQKKIIFGHYYFLLFDFLMSKIKHIQAYDISYLCKN